MSSGAKTKAGVGFCDSSDALFAGTHAAREALRSGAVTRPDFVYAFCHGKLDHEGFYAGVRQVVGRDAPIVGGSAVGVVTNDRLCYEGFPSGVAVIESDRILHRVAAAGDLDKGEEASGLSLARSLAAGPGDRMALLFFDWVRSAATGDTPPVLNASAPFLAGVAQGMDPGVPVVGAGLVGTYQIDRGKQFCGSYVGSQQAVGVALSGDCAVYSRIMHGCSPLDGIYRTITRMEGSFIYELDGRPIVGIMDDLFGNKEWRSRKPVNYLTLGVNYGDRYGEPREANYVNRLMIGVLPDSSGVSLFEPDFHEGVEIQFMLRDTKKMVESARANSRELMEIIRERGQRPVFALYIDCAGRTMEYSSSTEEESAEVQRVCNRYGVPLLGFYTGVEIAPLLGRSRGLDWTGVLAVVAEDM